MKSALVTGGNRGIGLEFVRQLAAAGWRVYAGTRRPDESKDLQDLMTANPDGVRLVRLEVRSEEDIAEAAATIAGESGALDLLINNAATFAHDEEGVEQTRADEMLRVLAVNSVAPIIVTRHLLPLLRKAETAKVVTVTSGASLLTKELPPPGSQYSYHASKATLNVYLQRLGADLREQGVISIGIGPGFVLTDMTRNLGRTPPLRPPESVSGMLAVIERLTMNDAGRFFSYSGERRLWELQ
jgi:NAD(P)-dependent dehydrogenase (short-subunit alcohol dehydrogenase family)